MNNTGNEKTELQDAVDNADVQKIDENLHHDKQDQTPESLSDKEDTPFINDKQRTDK